MTKMKVTLTRVKQTPVLAIEEAASSWQSTPSKKVWECRDTDILE